MSRAMAVFLQDAHKLRLGSKTKGIHVIQEHGGPSPPRVVSRMLDTNPVGIYSTVHALVLTTFFAQSATVQDNELEIAAPGLVMKATSNELLASPGLASDDHGNGRIRKQPYGFA